MHEHPDLPFEARMVCCDGGALVICHGEVDLATIGTFRAVMAEAIAVGGSVDVELSGVTFMDSTGLAVLAQAFRTLAPPRAITLHDPCPAVSRVLEISGLGSVVEVRLSDARGHREGLAT
jgi:anti-sigma B factor antagonist